MHTKHRKSFEFEIKNGYGELKIKNSNPLTPCQYFVIESNQKESAYCLDQCWCNPICAPIDETFCKKLDDANKSQ